jgi:hypothetical protein
MQEIGHSLSPFNATWSSGSEQTETKKLIRLPFKTFAGQKSNPDLTGSPSLNPAVSDMIPLVTLPDRGGAHKKEGSSSHGAIYMERDKTEPEVSPRLEAVVS